MVNNFSYSKAGQALTESFEGLRLTAYQDVAGVWTIGFGHTGPGVGPGMTIGFADAIALLVSDVASCVSFVNRVVTVPLNQGQFDALVDFAYNEGRGSLLRSTLLAKINAGQFDLADTEFAPWDIAAGEVNAGLARRRAAEAAMFAGTAAAAV